jgi:hypothetical protein
MPDAFCTRGLVCKKCGETHTRKQVQTEQSGIPCAMALRLMPCSPRRRIRLVTVVCGLRFRRTRLGRLASADLAPATGVETTRFCRTRTVFAKIASPGTARIQPNFSEGGNAVRPARRAIAHGVHPALRQRWRTGAFASITSRPAFVTTRDPPLLSERDGAN